MSIVMNASTPDPIRRWLASMVLAVALFPATLAGQERAHPSDGGPWIGLALICEGCESAGPWWDADAPIFQAPPRIHLIDPGGPAARAGLMESDVLLEIDGLPITSTPAWRRLRQATLGDTLAITFVRNGRTARTDLEVGWHRTARRGPSAAESSTQPITFAGGLAGVSITVTGSPGVTVREEEGIVVIVTPDATIRLVARSRNTGGGR